MRTLIVGKSSKMIYSNSRGYTFIELAVVIILIGIVMTLALPQLKKPIFTDNLKSTTRKMIGVMQELRNEAIDNQENYYLIIDFESNRLWCEFESTSDGDRFTAVKEASEFPDDVRIIDITYRYSDKKMTGQTSILFNKKGYVQPVLIHLESGDGRRLTLYLSPFQGRIKILEDYLTYEDI